MLVVENGQESQAHLQHALLLIKRNSSHTFPLCLLEVTGKLAKSKDNHGKRRRRPLKDEVMQ